MTGRGTPNGQDLIYKDEVYAIQGAIFDVYNEIGYGLLESVYQECLSLEFKARRIPAIEQPMLNVKYKGVVIDHYFKPDFICFDKIIVEIKAVNEITKEHRAQLFNYLRIGELRLGMLVNFGHHPKVKIERYII